MRQQCARRRTPRSQAPNFSTRSIHPLNPILLLCATHRRPNPASRGVAIVPNAAAHRTDPSGDAPAPTPNPTPAPPTTRRSTLAAAVAALSAAAVQPIAARAAQQSADLEPMEALKDKDYGKPRMKCAGWGWGVGRGALLGLGSGLGLGDFRGVGG